MDSQRRLQSDPNDIEALLTLQEIQMKMQNWCQSNVKPGQFTGELVKNLLPKENLQGGFQAWAKKVINFILKLKGNQSDREGVWIYMYVLN